MAPFVSLSVIPFAFRRMQGSSASRIESDAGREVLDGISRAKFTRALSMSSAATMRFAPRRISTSARTVAHSRPSVLAIIRIGS